MTNAKKVSLAFCLVLMFAFGAVVYALFHGYFDHGRFAIQEVKQSNKGLVAMVSRRSDDEALSGDQYFVLIGAHVFSLSELRSAYYGDDVIFRADSACISVSWTDTGALTVSCSGGEVVPSHIATEKHRVGTIAINYVNIPEKADSSGKR